MESSEVMKKPRSKGFLWWLWGEPPWYGPTPGEVEDCPYGELAWDEKQPDQSLRSVFNYVTKDLEAVRTWFEEKRYIEYCRSRLCQWGAVLGMSVGGVIPMVAQIWPRFPPILASVAIAMAGFFLLIDRQLDLSSGVSRHTQVIFDLTRELVDFRTTWEAERFSWRTKPRDEHELLKKARATLSKLVEISRAESSRWLATQQANLEELEKRIKEVEDKVKPSPTGQEPKP